MGDMAVVLGAVMIKDKAQVYTQEQVEAYRGEVRLQIGNSCLFDIDDWKQDTLKELLEKYEAKFMSAAVWEGKLYVNILAACSM
jgi:hypothetical protein